MGTVRQSHDQPVPCHRSARLLLRLHRVRGIKRSTSGRILHEDQLRHAALHAGSPTPAAPHQHDQESEIHGSILHARQRSDRHRNGHHFLLHSH